LLSNDDFTHHFLKGIEADSMSKLLAITTSSTENELRAAQVRTKFASDLKKDMESFVANVKMQLDKSSATPADL